MTATNMRTTVWLLVLVRVSAADEYVTFLPGELPIILSAPHGGSLRPEMIPDRTLEACGTKPTTVTDAYTKEIALLISDALFAIHGHRPSSVLSNLQRTKLDPNRAKDEAACGNDEAGAAWETFHASIDAATASASERCGAGLYIDLHGQKHSEQWIEFGYLVKGDACPSTPF